MKLIVNQSDFVFEMTKNYKLFQKLNSKKTILKKGKYKSELINLFCELKQLKTSKKTGENYLIFKKGLKKYKYNLDDENIKNFMQNLEKINLNEFKTIYKNMF